MSNKLILGVALVLASLYGCIWLFNHLNAWIAIFTFLLLILTANTLFNKRKKNEKTN